MYDNVVKQGRSLYYKRFAARKGFYFLPGKGNRSIFLILLFLFCTSLGNATNYYVSNSGSDSNAGTTPETAWQTISKVNKSTFAPGDQILLKAGDSFDGPLNISNSGTSDSMIYIGRYGTGSNPIIYGDNPNVTWSAVAGHTGVYSASVSQNSIQRVYDGNNNEFTKLTQGTDNLSTFLDRFAPSDWGFSWDTGLTYVRTSDGNTPSQMRLLEWVTLYVRNASYVIIDSIDVRNGHIGIMVAGGNYVTVENSNVQDMLNTGIYYTGYLGNLSFHGEIANNTVTRTGWTSVYLLKGGNHWVHNNTISHAQDTILNIYRGGEELCGIGLQQGSNNLVEHNDISYTKDSGFDFWYEVSTVVRYNNAFHVGSSAYPHGTGLKLYYNIFNLDGVGQGIGGGHFYDSDLSPAPDSGPNEIYNNTVYNFLSYGIFGNTDSVIYRNNLVIQKAQVALANLTIGVDIDYSVYYNTADDNPKNWYWNGSRYTTLSAFQSASGQEANSIAAAPLFTDAANGDFSLQAGSPAINAGTDVGLTQDINGNPIVGAPDIGAYEYGDNTDKISPVVAAFTIPATSTSFTVPIADFTATDNIGVTGYLVTETAATPTAGASGWSSDKPTTYTFSALQTKSTVTETKSLYAWAKDAAGNVSASRSATMTISYTIDPVYTTEDISICEGDAYEGWTTTGQYERTLTAASGGDSIVTTNLTVNPVYSVSEDIAIQKGESYQGWTESGQYERTLTSVTGCDSMVTTNLTVALNKYTTEDISICDGDSYEGWTTTGQYQRTLTAASGADSIVTTNLTVNPVYYIVEDITIEEGQSYEGWIQPGQYERTLTSISGCDSIVTTNLTVTSTNLTKYTTEDISICDGEAYEGWTTTGQYQRTLTAASGADSVVTTNLTVNPVYYIVEDITIEDGQSYEGWIQSGQYERTLTSISGCDSIVTTNLTVTTTNLTKYTIEDISICEGDAYEGWTTTGQYQRTLTAASGADSIVTTNLTVNPVYDIVEDITIQEGESYEGWTQSGQYVRNLTTINGCDSIVTTNLLVEQPQQTLTQTIALEKGWNIFSSYVVPADTNMDAVQQMLSADNLLVEVEDESSNTYEKDKGTWINAIGNMHRTEGYKIRLRNAANLTVTGSPVKLPLDIALSPGWNIISFPYNGAVDAMAVIQPLIDGGALEKVQDEKGNAIEYWGSSVGWINGIGNFIPGEGYAVQVNTSCVLTILTQYQKSAAIQLTNDLQPEYFGVGYPGNGTEHMNINFVGLNTSGFQLGDEIAAFDGLMCVGAVKINENNIENNIASLKASVSDKDTLNGFLDGNPVTLLVWHAHTGEVDQYEPNILDGSLVFQAQSSVFLENTGQSATAVNETESLNVEMYPNPADNKVTIRFSTLPQKGTKIELTDITGKQLMGRVVQSTREVLDIQSQPAGMYLVKITSGDNYTVNKLIIN